MKKHEIAQAHYNAYMGIGSIKKLLETEKKYMKQQIIFKKESEEKNVELTPRQLKTLSRIEFKLFCENLEKKRFLPFNFL